MPSFTVDSEGKRIKTDILVSGYIRECGTKCTLLIPLEINQICFEFWLIKVCDEWDKQFSSTDAEIKGYDVVSKNNKLKSIYGCLSVGNETIQTWQIKWKSAFSYSHFFCIGIIKDKVDILIKDPNKGPIINAEK